MSAQDLARRSSVNISVAGVNVTQNLKPYFISATFTDNEEDEADDLQIVLQDRESIWLTNWLSSMIDAAASSSGSSRLKIEATYSRENWNGDGKTDSIGTGSMELDGVDASGPPSQITIRATSMFGNRIGRTDQSRAWEAYYLSKIAAEISASVGMTCSFLSDKDPYYRRVEQFRMSDIKFLSRLSHEAGISLKVNGNRLVLFSQKTFEAKDAIFTIRRGSKTYTKYKLGTGKNETEYSSCRVSYVNPTTGKSIEATVTVDDYDASSSTNQQLEISAAVSSIAEAQNLAAKYLRLYNKFAKSVTFTLPGNPSAVAGVTIMLEGWGAFDGKYIIKQAKHTVSAKNGYTTTITCRPVLPYFDPPAVAVVEEPAPAPPSSRPSSGGGGTSKKTWSKGDLNKTDVKKGGKKSKSALNNKFVSSTLVSAAIKATAAKVAEAAKSVVKGSVKKTAAASTPSGGGRTTNRTNMVK